MSTNKEDADSYRLLQAERLLADFENIKGRPARTIEELEDFVQERGDPAKPIDPFAPQDA
jgi:hypothetical protein